MLQPHCRSKFTASFGKYHWRDESFPLIFTARLLPVGLSSASADSHQEGTQQRQGVWKHFSPKIPAELLRLLGGSALAVDPPFSPHLNETSEAGLFPGSLSPPSPLLPCLWGFLLKYLVLSNFVINLMLQK